MTRIRITVSRWLCNLADWIYSPPYDKRLTYGRAHRRFRAERIGIGDWPKVNTELIDARDDE